MRSVGWLLVLVLAAVGCGAAAASPTIRSSSGTTPTAPVATPSLAPSPTATPTREGGWAMDLRTLVEFRESRHPDPWHGIAREAYVAEVEAVVDRIGELGDDELLVETVRLAAMPTWAGRDGHGGIHPWGEGSYPVRMLPLRLYAFSDGIFVVDALGAAGDFVGDQVLAIAGHPVEDVLAAVEPLVPRDNAQQVLTHGMRLVVTVEILHGLGLLDDPGQPVTVRFAEAGEEPVAPIPMPAFEEWAGGHHTHSPPARPAGPAWLRDPHDSFWWEWQPESGTAYIQYAFVAGGYGTLLDEVEARIADGGVERVVLDLRHNPGGDNTKFWTLREFIGSLEELGIPAYVVIGRATFSAAGNLVTELERETSAILVGEDSGTSPNQFGDSMMTDLPHSGLVFRVASQWHVKSDPADQRITIEPDLRAPLSSSDYFGDRDPAMEAILADS